MFHCFTVLTRDGCLDCETHYRRTGRRSNEVDGSKLVKISNSKSFERLIRSLLFILLGIWGRAGRGLTVRINVDIGWRWESSGSLCTCSESLDLKNNSIIPRSHDFKRGGWKFSCQHYIELLGEDGERLTKFEGVGRVLLFRQWEMIILA